MQKGSNHILYSPQYSKPYYVSPLSPSRLNNGENSRACHERRSLGSCDLNKPLVYDAERMAMTLLKVFKVVITQTCCSSPSPPYQLSSMKFVTIRLSNALYSYIKYVPNPLQIRWKNRAYKVGKRVGKHAIKYIMQNSCHAVFLRSRSEK